MATLIILECALLLFRLTDRPQTARRRPPPLAKWGRQSDGMLHSTHLRWS